ncbi:hypothetical protein D9M72_349600 [compost metagenome]
MQHAFGHQHLALDRVRHAAHAAAQQRAARRAVAGRAVLDHAPRLVVFAAVDMHPRQDVAAPGQGEVVRAGRNALQRRQQVGDDVGVVAQQRDAALQYRQRIVLARAQAPGLGLHPLQAVLQSVGVAGIHLQVGLDQQQAEAGPNLFRRELPHQRCQLAEFAAREQAVRAAVHHVGGGRAVPGQHRVPHGLVDVAMRVEPLPGRCVHRGLRALRQPAEAPQQHFAQQRVQAVPGFAMAVAADLRDEQVVARQMRQPRGDLGGGFGPAQQGGAQRAAKAVAQRHAGEQAEVIRRQPHQHLALEIAGKGLCVAHLDRVVRSAALALQVDGKELQAGGPAVGEFMQPAGIAGVDVAQLFLQEADGFLCREAQVGQPE